MEIFEMINWSFGPIKPSYLRIIEYTHQPTRIGIIGDNGSGKSTVLNALANAKKYAENPSLRKEFGGEIRVKKKDLKVSYFNQNPEMNLELTVEEYIKEQPEIKKKLDILNQYNQTFADMATDDDEKLQEALELQSKLHEIIERQNIWEIENDIKNAMKSLGCPPANKLLKHTSGGEKRRVALCSILFTPSDILLLDEPTNHLDIEAIAWLEKHLKQYKGIIILVTHDRKFLSNLCNWILEIDQGELIPYKGDYAGWLEHKEKQLQQIKKDDELYQKLLKKEKEWVGKSNKTKTKAQIRMMQEKSYDDALKYRPTKGHNQIFIPPGPRLGNKVIIANNLSYQLEDGKQLFKNLSFEANPGSTIGVIGPNGAGKTTLMNIIANKIEPQSGDITLGATVKIAYNDQTREGLNPESTIWKEITGGLDSINLQSFEMNSRAYVAAFNFRGNAQQIKIKDVSGGEENRIHLAKTLTKHANVLILDEPTNDLDLKTITNLKSALENYPGVIFLVSHDRALIEDLSSHLIVFDGKGNATFNMNIENNLLK